MATWKVLVIAALAGARLALASGVLVVPFALFMRYAGGETAR